MATVTYIQPDGTRNICEVSVGRTVKDGAINNMVSGIVAECGGACSCATCHVYVAAEWVDTVGEPGDDETEMLDFAFEVAENSRLSCQIRMTSELDGLVVHIPKEQ